MENTDHLINLEIQKSKGVNLQTLSNIAVEFYGETVSLTENNLHLIFTNAGFAQQYKKVISPYFIEE